ncbi:MAG: hypothetical protein HOM84_08050 [Thiotrichales bacterium]|jgi:hypothetical protein|nr:hypothetical protein [Thiotrichales bacterium]MBT3612919.1 hypothetical protein [Thiotrichales bacterium]MBT3752408.1 hypothetical protein [Thiotrichales bacterium]MBT3836908.1 hypothetical protein [Thiotrichales bacterium]MBT4152481.1 hypothetical protein [Thiotrichales bacterium]
MISTASLSVESAPPILTPFRFFLTAPIFGVLFSLSLLLFGPELFSSRWNPSLIGTLHLVNIGVLFISVVGVLFQILPVVGGVQIPQQNRVATWMHIILSLGTLLYFVAFILVNNYLMVVAAILLAAALIPYIALILFCLFSLSNPSDTIKLLRYPALFLTAMAVIGTTLLFGWGGAEYGVNRHLTLVHLVWGLGGWFTLLLMVISFQMIPMFHVTPDFPDPVRKYLVPIVAVTLLGWGVGWMLEWNLMSSIALILAALGFIIYSITAFNIMSQRRRKVLDVTIYFWRFAIVVMVVASLTTAIFTTISLYTPLSATSVFDGVAVVWIFLLLLPMLSGTLMKIAPFLVFLHLQQQITKSCFNHDGEGSPPNFANLSKIPNLFQILPTHKVEILFWLFLTTLLGWIAVLVTPLGIYLLGVTLFLYFGWMGWLILNCYRLYREKMVEFAL